MNVDHLEYDECSNRLRNGKTNMAFPPNFSMCTPRVWKSGGEHRKIGRKRRSRNPPGTYFQLQAIVAMAAAPMAWGCSPKKPHFATNFTERKSQVRIMILSSHTITGWWYTMVYLPLWYTYPSEKWWSSSVVMIPFPIWWESHNPAMFQSPPTR